MRINNNIMAMNTHRQYTINNSSVSKSVEKLSSGYRINRAGDDAAGLAISEKMRAQIRGLTMASKNSQDAISLVQTAEGALQESHNILQRMRELAVQSASDTNETTVDRDALNKEFQALIAELDDTASKAKFNDQGLIDGTFSKSITAATSNQATRHAVAWAADTVSAGAYTITATSTEVVAGVSAVTGSVTASTAFTVGASKGAYAGGAVTWDDSTAALNDESLNGVWNFTMSDGKITAENQRTGQRVSRDWVAVGDGATETIDFGALGKLSLTNSGAETTNANEFTSISGSITIGDCVSEKAAVYKHYANLGTDQVELKTGMTVLDFKDKGISVSLKNSLSVDNYDDTVMTTAVDGTITVNKSNGKDLVIQTGANKGDELAVNIGKMDSYTLGVKSANIANRLDASAAIQQVNTALNQVSTQRAALGALQNRLEHKISNLDTSAENLSAAESRIRDLDMAKEMTTFTKNNILVQASTAMLAQANAAPQGVLQLLQ